MSRLRSSTAAAVGIGGAGRCATTAIVVGIGHYKDPAVQHAHHQVDHWISVRRSESRLRAIVYWYWSAMISGCINLDCTINWPHINGPMTGTITLLSGYGFRLTDANKWPYLDANQWIADMSSSRAPILDPVKEPFSKHLWLKASEHYLGQDSAEGVELNIALP